MTNSTNYYKRLRQQTGALQGVVTQAVGQVTRSSFAWSSLADCPGGSDLPCPPAYCWRSVSQRTLSHPITWMADLFFVNPLAGNVYLQAFNPLELPTEPLVDLDTTDTDQITQYYDNDDDRERGDINNLVLIGLRASGPILAVTGRAGTADPDRFDGSLSSVVRGLRSFSRHYLSFRLTQAPGRRDSWVFDTPLAYLTRPGGEFVAVPPLLWNTRDVTASWVSRPPDFQPSGADIPNLESNGLPAQQFGAASLLVEGLFVPNPSKCPADWPGQWCPPEAILGHPKYDRAYARRRIAGLSQLAAKVAAGLGS